jgi:hypothetical protein
MKNCLKCKEKFEVTTEDLEFYKKIEVPEPTLCSDCRQQRRFVYRNEWGLHKRKCSGCKKKIIAMFPEGERKVYCEKCWWSDDFNPLEYGQDFDFERPFFEQIKELMDKTPLPHLVIGGSENSDYTNYSWKLKNCYLMSSSDYIEDCLYSAYLMRSKNCVDCLFVQDSELLYECIDCKKCYNSIFLQNCKEVIDSAYCFDCHSCKNCLGCVGLHRKKYHIFNKEYSKEEFEKKKKNFFEKYKDLDELRAKFLEFKLQFVHKYASIENCDNVVGDCLISCKDCNKSFDLIECEDCNYSSLGVGSKDCMDCIGIPETELAYESACIPENYSMKFCWTIWPKASYLEYCILSRASHNCFGCVSLNKNQHCILNKQYSKEEYEKMVKKIKAHMIKTKEYGEFFPMEMTPFEYTETLAQDHYPRKVTEKKSQKTDVSGEFLTCKVTGKKYRLTKQEIDFYKKMNLPNPSKSPIQRHKERMLLRNPRKLWTRRCEKCETNIQTSYSSKRPEKIYCQNCYLKERY